MNATVFYDRIERFKDSSEIDLATVLGHAIAHEIGHVLLGTTAHSPAGIMKARWSQADFQVAALRGMKFTSLQREEILRHQRALPVGVLDAAEPRPKITVFVYNYAAAGPDVLALTEAEASRIYQQAGIEVQWLECPLRPKDADQFPACQIAPGPTRLALRILSRSMADRLRQAEDSFGFAMIPEDGSFAIVANVFSYDAEQLANRRDMRHGVILGHLAAHELGHVLLGSGSHSSQCIMHVPWQLKELDIIAQGQMVFMPREAERMRRNIQTRAAGERTTETVARGT